MRKVLLLIILQLPFLAMANEIDKIKTQPDVVTFLQKNINRKIDAATVFINNFDTTQKIRSFYKLDIDRNGLTDLLVNGRNTFYVLDAGDGDYSANYLDRNASLPGKFSFFALLDTSDRNTKIVLGHAKEFNPGINTVKLAFDTLIFKFGGFIEYNTDTLQYLNFQSISIKTSQCFGRCPIFSITVHSDGAADYNAIKYNEETGEFAGQVPQEDLNLLTGLLKYINPQKLKNSYSVNWTDYQTATTTIEFNDKEIQVKDYGEMGSYGLMRLYSILFSWRKKQTWEKL